MIPETIQVIQPLINVKSKQLFSYLLLYITILLFLFSVTTSTSHQTIILSDVFKFPIIPISLNLNDLFLFGPLLIFVLFLFNIYLLSIYINARNVLNVEISKSIKIKNEKQNVHKLFIFTPIDILVPKKVNSSNSTVQIISIIIFYIYLPVVFLIYMILKYIPSHNLDAIYIIRLCIVMIIIVGFYFTNKIVKLFIDNRAIICSVKILYFLFSLFIFSFIFGVLLIPGEKIEKALIRVLPEHMIRYVEYPAIEGDKLRFGASYSGVAIRIKRAMLSPTFFLFEAPTTPFNLRRNIVLKGVDLVPQHPNVTVVDKLGIKAAWTQIKNKLDLRGRNLEYADLTDSDLSGAKLGGALLRGAQLNGSKLRYVDARPLTGATEVSCAGKKTEAQCSTVLNLSNLQGADLTGADFLGAIATAVNFSGLTQAKMRDVSFTNAQLGISAMEKVDASGAVFAGADLTGVDFRGADLRFADLQNADLSAAFLYNVNLTGANLESAHLKSTWLSESTLYGAKLAGAKFVGTNLYLTNFAAASLKLEGIIPVDYQIFAEFENVNFSQIQVEKLSEVEVEDLKKTFEKNPLKTQVEELLEFEISRFYPHKQFFTDSLIPTGKLYDGSINFDSWGMTRPDFKALASHKSSISIEGMCIHEDEYFTIGILRQIGFNARRDKLKFNNCTSAPDILGPCIRKLSSINKEILLNLMTKKLCESTLVSISKHGLLSKLNYFNELYNVKD